MSQSLPEFLLDWTFGFLQARLSRLEIRLAWERERSFFVLILFSASGFEMEWGRSSSVLVKQLATEWALALWLDVSDVFALASALVLLLGIS